MRFDCTVIGAGVVGLAVARAIALRNRSNGDVLVVDKAERCGTGISSRNSEVIHAGIYYPTGSLKHRLCIQGRRLLYAYCEKAAIPFRKCGKLIVASDATDVESLERVLIRARENEVENVVRLGASQTAALEPRVNAYEALLSQETGIVDSHTLIKALVGDFEDAGGTVALRQQVVGIDPVPGGFSVLLHDGTRFESTRVVNAAGLGACLISTMLGLATPPLFPCKGDYFSYAGAHGIGRLVYPLPDPNLTQGLGVHATIDMGGRLRFGPDATYVDDPESFCVDERKADAFFRAAATLLKGLDRERIAPDMAGIRPRLQGPTSRSIVDFQIEEVSDLPGFINLLGIESPGLTAALAIGVQVAEDVWPL